MRPSKHWFGKVRSCLTNLIVCNQVTYLVDKEKTTDVGFLDINKAFDTVSHRIVLKKLATYGLDGWTVCCIKTVWMAGPREWWSIESNPVCERSLVEFLSSQYWDWSCLKSLSVFWMRELNSISSQTTPIWVGVLICWRMGRLEQRDLDRLN